MSSPRPPELNSATQQLISGWNQLKTQLLMECVGEENANRFIAMQPALRTMEQKAQDCEKQIKVEIEEKQSSDPSSTPTTSSTDQNPATEIRSKLTATFAKLLSRWETLRLQILSSALMEDSAAGFKELQPMIRDINKKLSDATSSNTTKLPDGDIIEFYPLFIQITYRLEQMLNKVANAKETTSFNCKDGSTMARNKYALVLESEMKEVTEEIDELYNENATFGAATRHLYRSIAASCVIS